MSTHTRGCWGAPRLLAAGWLALLLAPAAAQVPDAALVPQIYGELKTVRQEVRRQREVLQRVQTDLTRAQTDLRQTRQEVTDLRAELAREQGRRDGFDRMLYGLGAGLVLVGFLAAAALRRPAASPSAGRTGEPAPGFRERVSALEARLTALDERERAPWSPARETDETIGSRGMPRA